MFKPSHKTHFYIFTFRLLHSNMETKVKIIKWTGLFFAIVLPVISATSRLWTHNTNYDFTAWSYILYVLPTLILLAIIRFGEKESFSSLGLLKFNLKTFGSMHISTKRRSDRKRIGNQSKLEHSDIIRRSGKGARFSRAGCPNSPGVRRPKVLRARCAAATGYC